MIAYILKILGRWDIMRNSLCEKIVWYALSPSIFKFIEQSWTDIDIKNIKNLSKSNYRDMVKRTPDMGSFRKNPFRIPLAGGMLWLSIYEAMAGKMNQEQFLGNGECYNRSSNIEENFSKTKGI